MKKDKNMDEILFGKVDYKLRQGIITNCNSSLYYKLQQGVITNCDRYVITNCNKFYYKLRQVLQIVTLLQIATVQLPCQDPFKYFFKWTIVHPNLGRGWGSKFCQKKKYLMVIETCCPKSQHAKHCGLQVCQISILSDTT